MGESFKWCYIRSVLLQKFTEEFLHFLKGKKIKKLGTTAEAGYLFHLCSSYSASIPKAIQMHWMDILRVSSAQGSPLAQENLRCPNQEESIPVQAGASNLIERKDVRGLILAQTGHIGRKEQMPGHLQWGTVFFWAFVICTCHGITTGLQHRIHFQLRKRI